MDVDERIDRLEALVIRALCKCVIGHYWIKRNNCPIHPQFTPIEQILKDKQGFVREGN